MNKEELYEKLKAFHSPGESDDIKVIEKELVNELIQYFQGPRLSRPVMALRMDKKSFRKSFKKADVNNFFVTPDGTVYFLYDVRTNTPYVNEEALKKNISGYTYCGYRETPNISKYVKHLDIICKYRFFIDKNGEFQVESIEVFPRKKDSREISYINTGHSSYNEGLALHASGASCKYFFSGPLGDRESFKTAVSKMYGTVLMNTRANNFIDISNDYSFREFLRTNTTLKRTSSKAQKELDELCTFNFKKIKSADLKKYYDTAGIKRYYRNGNITYVERTEDDTVCIRLIKSLDNFDDTVDTMRIFVKKDGSVLAGKFGPDGDYIKYNIASISPTSFGTDLLVNFNNETIKGTSLEKFKKTINKAKSESSKTIALIGLVNSKFLRELAEIDFDLSGYIYQYGKANPVTNICEQFGVSRKIKPTEGIEVLDMNKEKIKIISDVRANSTNFYLIQETLDFISHFSSVSLKEMPDERFEKLLKRFTSSSERLRGNSLHQPFEMLTKNGYSNEEAFDAILKYSSLCIELYAALSHEIPYFDKLSEKSFLDELETYTKGRDGKYVKSLGFYEFAAFSKSISSPDIASKFKEKFTLSKEYEYLPFRGNYELVALDDVNEQYNTILNNYTYIYDGNEDNSVKTEFSDSNVPLLFAKNRTTGNYVAAFYPDTAKLYVFGTVNKTEIENFAEKATRSFLAKEA